MLQSLNLYLQESQKSKTLKEIKIVECGYDFKDCCHLDSDRSLCTDCLCYIQEVEKILLDEEFNKNCPHELNWAWGDKICDLSLMMAFYLHISQSADKLK